MKIRLGIVEIDSSEVNDNQEDLLLAILWHVLLLPSFRKYLQYSFGMHHLSKANFSLGAFKIGTARGFFHHDGSGEFGWHTSLVVDVFDIAISD